VLNSLIDALLWESVSPSAPLNPAGDAATPELSEVRAGASAGEPCPVDALCGGSGGRPPPPPPPPPPPAQSCRYMTCSVPAMNACFTPLRRTFPLVVLSQGRELKMKVTSETVQCTFVLSPALSTRI
jgi:hypothetical protein